MTKNAVLSLFNYEDIFADYFMYCRDKMGSSEGLKIRYEIPVKGLEYSSESGLNYLSYDLNNMVLYNSLDCSPFFPQTQNSFKFFKREIDARKSARFILANIPLFLDETYDISINGIQLDIETKPPQMHYSGQFLVPGFKNALKNMKDFPIDNNKYIINIVVKILKQSTTVLDYIRDNGINVNKDFILQKFKSEIDLYKESFDWQLSLKYDNYRKNHDPNYTKNNQAGLNIQQTLRLQIKNLFENDPIFFKELKSKASRLISLMTPHETMIDESSYHRIKNEFENEIDSIKLNQVINVDQKDVLLIIDKDEEFLYRSYKKSLEMIKDMNGDS